MEKATRSASCYMVASVGMVIANKEAVSRVKSGTLLLSFQLAITCATTVVLHYLKVSRIEGNMKDALRWTPVGVLSGLLLWAGMQAVKYASLSTLTVLRNATPLILLVAEKAFFGAVITPSMVISLIVVLMGISVYAYDDLHSEAALGVCFVLLDSGIVCMDRLLERYLLQLRPLDLSNSALVLVSNSIGFCFTVLLLLGPLRREISEARWPVAGINWAAASCVGGVAIAYAGISLGKNLSATGALLVANVDKVLVLCYGVLVLGDSLNSLKLLGCSMALLGAALHAWARLKVQGAGSESLISQGEELSHFTER